MGMLSARLEAGGGIGVHVELAGFGGIFNVFGFDDAVSIQCRYPLKPALVIWPKGIRSIVLWYTRSGVATLDSRRRGSLGIVLRLFRRLLVLVTNIFGRSGTTRGWLGRFLVTVFNIQLLVRTDCRIGKGHELVEHGELELQLDAIDHRLQCGFNLVNIRVLHG